MKRMRGLLTALTVSTVFLLIGVVTPAHAAPVICEKFGSTTVQSGRYVVMNNVWGADTAQCIDVNQSGGFTVTQSAHNKATNGAPASYPAIYAGCHYANCSSGSGLPMQATSGNFANVRTSVSMSYPGSGVFDAAYDIWFDPTPRTDGQNTGAEIMVWLNHTGAIQPVGSRIGTANLAGGTWDVWEGNVGWNVISYVRTSATTSMNFAVSTFFNDSVSRGFAQRNWYLTSVQAGFEPWVGGAGLAVNSFTYTTTGNPDPTPSVTPSQSPSSSPPPTGGGGCTYRIDSWNTGYTVTLTVNGPVNGWSRTATIPAGHTFQNGWSATFTTSGQNVNIVPQSWNSNLGSGQSTQVGFQASRPNGNTALPTVANCTRV